MRFAIAVAILAQGLAAASNPAGVDLGAGEATISNDALSKLSRPGSHRKLSSHGSILSQVQAGLHQLQQRKCNPDAATSVATDADVGILGCEPGEHCSEFGVCVADAAGVSVRATDIGTGPDFNYFDYLCNTTAPYVYVDGPYSCNCTKADPSTESGFIYCEGLETQCDGGLCYDLNFGFGFTGDFTEYAYTYYCLDISTPYKQEVCYFQATGSDVCAIYIDDQECTSCLIEASANGGNCFTFDCTNVAGGNTGNDCLGDHVTGAFDGLPDPPGIVEPLTPVEGEVKYLQAILTGISSMSYDEQVDWATLTAEYIVSYYANMTLPVVEDLAVLIDVLAVIPGRGRDPRRDLQDCGGSVVLVYNTYVSYSIEDPNLYSPGDIVEMPFLTEEDQQAYVDFIVANGQGDLVCLSDFESMGQRQPMRPAKGGKKSQKKSSKSSKSSKASYGKGAQIYHPPPLDYLEPPPHHTKSSKKGGYETGKGYTETMYGYPVPQHGYPAPPHGYPAPPKSSKKGKSRRR